MNKRYCKACNIRKVEKLGCVTNANGTLAFPDHYHALCIHCQSQFNLLRSLVDQEDVVVMSFNRDVNVKSTTSDLVIPEAVGKEFTIPSGTLCRIRNERGKLYFQIVPSVYTKGKSEDSLTPEELVPNSLYGVKADRDYFSCLDYVSGPFQLWEELRVSLMIG